MKTLDRRLITKIKSFSWEKWLERPFSPFILSLFVGGISKKAFKKIGMPGVECEAFIYENNIWYQSEKVWDKMAGQFDKYLLKNSIFDITSSLSKYHEDSRKKISSLIKNKKLNNFQKLQIIREIINPVTTYIWAAHGLEYYYTKKLQAIVPKYMKGNIDLFIGDASFPKKKNEYVLFEEAIRQKNDPKKIIEKFGWMRARDGFEDPFTEKDIKNYKIDKKEQHKKVKIPKPLQKIFSEVQELVYFRTQRTDVFYELIFRARPIIKETGKELGINFQELKKYTIESLIEKKPVKYTGDFSCIAYKDGYLYLRKPIFKKDNLLKSESIKGMIAQKGIARGTVRIVKTVSEVGKVKGGDILVTQMTFPSFISAMKRAAAFITDEGGITCHAAIVAREMKKPCIIGTKIATHVLKDGDFVEVNANKGIVKILKKAH